MSPRSLASGHRVDETPGFPVGRVLVASGIDITGMTQQLASTTHAEAMRPLPAIGQASAMVISPRSQRSFGLIAAGPGVEFQHVCGVRLAPEVERAMIGIVQEALHDVGEHADADSIRSEVRRVDGEVEIVVGDDGGGFAVGSPDGHVGLEQVRVLADETAGRIETGSSPGARTAVRAWIPVGTLSTQATTELTAHRTPGRPVMGRLPRRGG